MLVEADEHRGHGGNRLGSCLLIASRMLAVVGCGTMITAPPNTWFDVHVHVEAVDVVHRCRYQTTAGSSPNEISGDISSSPDRRSPPCCKWCTHLGQAGCAAGVLRHGDIRGLMSTLGSESSPAAADSLKSWMRTASRSQQVRAGSMSHDHVLPAACRSPPEDFDGGLGESCDHDDNFSPLVAGMCTVDSTSGLIGDPQSHRAAQAL